MTRFPDDTALAEIEAHAAGAARRAGAVLAQRFGGPLRVEYKDDRKGDPVTTVDREVQRQIAEGISERFPEHGIVGEEDPEDDATVRELTWVLDPLDGTTNFISGLPLYASSVGVLHRGRPVAGAVFLSWPCPEGGVVMHARRGGGAFRDGEPLGPAGETGREGPAIAGMPGSFASVYRFRKAARERVGEPRVMGSIVYELGLVALGALDYSVVNAPRLWDVAAGVLLIAETGGLVVRGRRVRGVGRLLGRTSWEPMEALVAPCEEGVTRHAELRRWSTPLAAGRPEAVGYVTARLRRRR